MFDTEQKPAQSRRGQRERERRTIDSSAALEREADRAAASAVAGGAVGSLTWAGGPTGAQRKAAQLLVDDGADVGPGQLTKSVFISRLRAEVCAAADAVLRPAGRSSDGCPQIDQWFGYYADRSAEQVERAIYRYAPESDSASTAADYVAPIVARIRTAVERWVATGEVTGVPDATAIAAEAIAGAGAEAASAVAAAAVGLEQGVTATASAVGGAVSEAVRGAEGALSAISSVLFKGRDGTIPPQAEPGAIRDRLGAGEPLPGATRARMETAFGLSFHEVRVHADSAAGSLADELSARAFTVGNDIGFGRGEFRPGSLHGDALLAHELAHTVQQRGAGPSTIEALEQDADLAAVSVLRPGRRRPPVLRSGLQLARCSKSSTTAPAPVVPRTETTEFGTYRIVADTFAGTLAPDQLKQSDFVKLETAWKRVKDGSGGLQISGSAADKAELIAMIGREMGRSKTFRDLIVEITEDTARPVTVNVGRNNAYWVDEFSSNVLDLDDLAWFEDIPPAAYPWVQTSGEILVHILAERRHGVVHGTGYDPAHEAALAAGGPQEQYRTDRGQTGRFVSQVGAEISPGLRVGTYTDTAGNKVLIRRDNSAGAPIVYEMEYVPNAPTAAAPGLTRRNQMTARVTRTGGAAPVAGTTVAVRFSGATLNATAPAVALGAGQTYQRPLGDIVPTGGPITVEVIEQPPTGPPTVLMTTAWNHPFSSTTATATIGVAKYDLDLRLQRTP